MIARLINWINETFSTTRHETIWLFNQQVFSNDGAHCDRENIHTNAVITSTMALLMSFSSRYFTQDKSVFLGWVSLLQKPFQLPTRDLTIISAATVFALRCNFLSLIKLFCRCFCCSLCYDPANNVVTNKIFTSERKFFFLIKKKNQRIRSSEWLWLLN